MNILKQLFGKKESNIITEDIPAYYATITDYIVDWFKADNLSITNFQEQFDSKYWKPTLTEAQEYGYTPNFHERFIPSALYFLIALSNCHEKNIQRLSDIGNILEANNLTEYSRDNFFIDFRNFNESDELINTLKKGATIVDNYRTFVEKDRISTYSLATDLNYYIPFIKALPVNKLYIYSKLYIDRDDTDKLPYTEKILPLILEEINNINQHEAIKLDYKIVMEFLQVLSFGRTKEWSTIQESRKRKTDFSKIPVFKSFIDQAEGSEQKYLTNIFYFIQKKDIIPYSLYSALDQMILEIIGNNKFNQGWVLDQFKTKDESFYPFLGKIINNISEELKVGDNLVTFYEDCCFDNFNDYSLWKLDNKLISNLENIYNKVEDLRIRRLYLARIHGIKVMSRSHDTYNYKYTRIYDDEKLDKTQNLISELNYILPITIKNVLNKGYFSPDEDNIDRALIVCDGQEMILSDERLSELNEILDKKQTGYQLIPIPISENIINNYIYTLGALLICNYEEYLFIESLYNSLPPFKHLLPKISYSETNAVPFQLLKEKKSSATSIDSGFIANTDWQWFKDRYIDKLSSKDKWYDIMSIVIQCNGNKTVNKKWLSELTPLVDNFPPQKYYQELQALLSESMKEDFWFFDTYQKALKGLIWSCTIHPSELSLNIIRLIIEKAYTKVPGIGPKSTALGNFAINVLISTKKEEAFGMLNVMRNKTKYNRFALVLDKAMDKFKEDSDLPEQLLADKTIPRFDFIDNERIISLGDHFLKLYFEKGKLQKKWITQEGKSQNTVPLSLSEVYASEIKELNNEVKQINQVYKDLGKRIRTYWLYNRAWNACDWKEFILNHPLINPHIQNLIWTNTTRGDDFIVSNNALLSVEGKEYQLNDSDNIVLWHPVINNNDNIKRWQDYIWDNKIVQSERQVFREYYPFSSTEIKMSESPRFASHFLEVNKLMAIANNQGWIFTYVHEGYNWPRIYIKPLDITFHLKSDYSRNEFAMPTEEIFATKGNTTKIEYSNEFDKIKFSEIPYVTLSELCRDIDLFIATTTVANNPDLAERQIYESYYQSYEKGLFSDNATAKVRHEILENVLPALGISSPRFDGNFLLIEGSHNSYKINLGSGYAQTKSGKHLNILPAIDNIKKNKKVILPIEDDDILYHIIAKAILLSNDKEITDERLQSILD